MESDGRYSSISSAPQARPQRHDSPGVPLATERLNRLAAEDPVAILGVLTYWLTPDASESNTPCR
jgi:hypothetical protein